MIRRLGVLVLAGFFLVWDLPFAEARPQSALPRPVGVEPGKTVVGRVVRVSDGDTIVLLVSASGRERQLKVRMLGIDAPEKSQPFGNFCKDALARQVAAKEVQLWIKGFDRYDRTLGKVQLGGKDINLAQIEAGCAWHYKQYQRSQTREDRERYARAEQASRSAQRGLWRDRKAQAPWEFRRLTKAHRR